MQPQRNPSLLISRLLLALALIGLAGAGLLGKPWAYGLAVVLLMASALATLLRALQLQNVCVAAALSLVISSGVIYLNARTSIPFGPVAYGVNSGEQLLEGLPPIIPLLWLAVWLTARGVARLILRPWRKLRTYGFRVIGLTIGLTVLFDFGLEPFAAHVNHFWFWQPTAIASTWFGTPWLEFFGRAVATLLILAFATPWLINKMPSGSRRVPDFQPLILWGAVNLFLAVSLAAHQLWLAVIVVAVQTVTVSVLAWKNAG